MFTCNSLRPAYCLSLRLHLPPPPPSSFSILPWKVVPSHELELVQLKSRLQYYSLCNMYHIGISSPPMRSTHCTRATRLVKTKTLVRASR